AGGDGAGDQDDRPAGDDPRCGGERPVGRPDRPLGRRQGGERPEHPLRSAGGGAKVLRARDARGRGVAPPPRARKGRGGEGGAEKKDRSLAVAARNSLSTILPYHAVPS